MADKNSKVADNVIGVFYVDETCVDCDACRSVAPDHFVRNDETGYTYVAQQPGTEDDYQLCVDAMASCPTESIGDDGDE